MQRREKAIKSLPAFKLDVAVGYVESRRYGRLCRSCIPNLSCFELFMWWLQTIVYSYWRNNFRTVSPHEAKETLLIKYSLHPGAPRGERGA